MNFSDLMIITIRWLHVMATITWIGGNIIFYVVLRPSASEINSKPNSKSFGQSFGEIVELSKWVLIITGALLTLDNLATRIEIPYFTILTLKVALSFLMFIMGYRSVTKSPVHNSNNGFMRVFFNRFKTYKLTQFPSKILGQITTRNTIFVLGPIVVFHGIALRVI